mgnify:FL=1
MVTIKLVQVSDTDDLTSSEVLGYNIPNFDSFNISVRTPISPMPLPEEKADENVLVKMEGNTSTVNLAWTLVNSATDLNFGKKSDEYTHVKTVPQQLAYLSNGMQGDSIQDKFKLVIGYSLDSDGNQTGEKDLVFDGFVTNLTFSQSGSAPVTFKVQMAFIQGRVITTLDGDVAKPPTSIGLVMPSLGGGAGRITASWTAPSYKGGADVVSDYDLEFLNSTTGAIEYKKYAQTASPFTTPTDSLSPHTKFRVRIRANSIVDGKGMWSEFTPVKDADGNIPDGVASTWT